MVTIDVVHVFRVTGGVRGLLDCLNRHSPTSKLTYNAAQMWQRRNQIPAKWVGAVLYCVARDGHNMTEFLIDPDELR